MDDLSQRKQLVITGTPFNTSLLLCALALGVSPAFVLPATALCNDSMEGVTQSTDSALGKGVNGASPAGQFGINFGLNLGVEFGGGMGTTTKYTHNKDAFTVSSASPLFGGEFSAEKSLLDMFGMQDNAWVVKNDVDLVTRASLALFQGDLRVQQSGVQNREITVTHRLLRAHLSILFLKSVSDTVSLGGGFGLGFANLNQAGLGVSDTFFKASYPAFSELQAAYSVYPDLAVVVGLRKFGFSLKSEDTSNAIAGFLGIVMGL